MTHRIHHWSNDCVACHCEQCCLPLARYVEWLEGIAEGLAARNTISEPDPALAALIERAREHPIGSDLAERAI